MIRPEVSVVMAIKNSERFIRDALESIAAQTFDKYELIVVDGGSTDHGPMIAQAYPKTICIQQQAGKGLAHAWNSGIAASRAPFVAFLDSDDLWMPDTLAAQLAAFGHDPGVEYVFGRTEFFLDQDQALPTGFRPELLGASHLVPMTGSSLIRRAVVDRMGPFDETLRIASDIAWFAALRKAKSHALDKILLRKRLHAGSLGQSIPWPIFKSELLQIARQRAAEQRKSAVQT
jgi:glycosyltransferase involved in cell wall biosynthesis